MMNDEYNKESKEAYIESSIKGFAYELFLLNKHKAKEDVNINIHLYEYLDTGFILTDKEEKAMIKKAIKIAKKEYGLSL